MFLPGWLFNIHTDPAEVEREEEGSNEERESGGRGGGSEKGRGEEGGGEGVCKRGEKAYAVTTNSSQLSLLL